MNIFQRIGSFFQGLFGRAKTEVQSVGQEVSLLVSKPSTTPSQPSVITPVTVPLSSAKIETVVPPAPTVAPAPVVASTTPTPVNVTTAWLGAGETATVSDLSPKQQGLARPGGDPKTHVDKPFEVQKQEQKVADEPWVKNNQSAVDYFNALDAQEQYNQLMTVKGLHGALLNEGVDGERINTFLNTAQAHGADNNNLDPNIKF